jgi:hypothetical protein
MKMNRGSDNMSFCDLDLVRISESRFDLHEGHLSYQGAPCTNY